MLNSTHNIAYEWLVHSAITLKGIKKVSNGFPICVNTKLCQIFHGGAMKAHPYGNERCVLERVKAQCPKFCQ
jgi:hypothetical protein